MREKPETPEWCEGEMHSDVEYRTIFETTGTAMVIIEADMTICLVNGEFEKLSGYDRSEIEGRRKFPEFVAPEDLERMGQYHYARRRDPAAAPRNYQFHFVDRYGAEKEIYMTIAVIPGSQKSVGAFLDITEHNQALNALAESEQRFRSLVENSHTGIFIIQDDRIIYKNPAQERLFGPPPQESKITNIENIHPDDREKVQVFHEHIRSERFEPLDIDYRFYVRKGDVGSGLRWVHCRASRIEYLKRKATLVNMMDITKTRELEHQVRIKDKMVALGHVAAGIAHEIRNPLSGINVFLAAIRENFEDPANADDIRGLIDQAKAASGRIESVIKRVLDFVRPGAPRLRPADVNQAISEALLLARVSLRKSAVALETDLQEGLPLLQADAQLIEQVILNLINNAYEVLRETGAGGTVRVSSAQEGRAVAIVVEDSGPGIAPGNREKVFDPFFTTKAEGSGIGLSICQRIITEHGGTIAVFESVLGGARFVVTLPCPSAA